MRTHWTVVSATWRSRWIDGIATLTIATSRTVMKKAAPTIARVSQRRSAAELIFPPSIGSWGGRTRRDDGVFRLRAAVGPSGQRSAVTVSSQRRHGLGVVRHALGALPYDLVTKRHPCAREPGLRCPRGKARGGPPGAKVHARGATALCHR